MLMSALTESDTLTHSAVGVFTGVAFCALATAGHNISKHVLLLQRSAKFSFPLPHPQDDAHCSAAEQPLLQGPPRAVSCLLALNPHPLLQTTSLQQFTRIDKSLCNRCIHDSKGEAINVALTHVHESMDSLISLVTDRLMHDRLVQRPLE